MRISAILIVLALACAATAHAQDPSPVRKDILGLGDLGKDRPAGSVTEITAQTEATFEEQQSRAIFTGDVRVKDPAFLLSSDKLTVYLNKARSGIERAIAEGNVVIVQRTSDPGEKGAVGRARRAEYVPATGQATLSGSPEIQQGINRHIASSPETRMILNRDGRATTEGPSRTVITDTKAMEGLQ